MSSWKKATFRVRLMNLNLFTLLNPSFLLRNWILLSTASVWRGGNRVSCARKGRLRISQSFPDVALLDSPLIPSEKFKIEDDPFSPEIYPADTDMYSPLPLPQGPVPPPATTPVPHCPIRLNGVYYQLVPAPHNVVVAQSTVPTPSIVPIEPAEAPALSTPYPVVPIEPAEATASSTEGAACNHANCNWNQDWFMGYHLPIRAFGAYGRLRICDAEVSPAGQEAH